MESKQFADVLYREIAPRARPVHSVACWNGSLNAVYACTSLEAAKAIEIEETRLYSPLCNIRYAVAFTLSTKEALPGFKASAHHIVIE